MDIHINDLLWLAGILEGDGCFSCTTALKKNISIKLEMVDKDTVEKFAKLLDLNISERVSFRKNHQKTFVSQAYGEKCLMFIKALLPYMGIRRRSKIKSIIELREVSFIPPIKSTVDFEKLKEERKTHTLKELSLKYDVHLESIRQWLLKPTSIIKKEKESISVINEKSPDILFWLVGLLEAEGSFVRGTPSQPNTPIISIQMTDEDIIAKIATLFGRKYRFYDPVSTKNNRKRVYSCTIKGAPAVEWMKKFKPHMSIRRQAQIQAALDSYNPNHAQETRVKRGLENRSLSGDQLEEIKGGLLQGETMKGLSKKYNVSHGAIGYAVCFFIDWSDVKEIPPKVQTTLSCIDSYRPKKNKDRKMVL